MLDGEFGLADDKLFDNITKDEEKLRRKKCKDAAHQYVRYDLKEARRNQITVYAVPCSGVLTTICLGTMAYFCPDQFLVTTTLAAMETTSLLIPLMSYKIEEANSKVKKIKENEKRLYKTLYERLW